MRSARAAESSGKLLCRRISARTALEACCEALRMARAAGAGESCRRLRRARASLGGAVRHLDGLYGRACEREFRERQAEAQRARGARS